VAVGSLTLSSVDDVHVYKKSSACSLLVAQRQ